MNVHCTFQFSIFKIKTNSDTRQEAQRYVYCCWITIELHIASCNNGNGGKVARSPGDVTGEQWPVLLIELSHCNLQSEGDASHCYSWKQNEGL